MAAPAPPFIVVDLSASWGAASIGNYLAMALLAFQFAQTFYYLHNYREDRWVMKSMAVLLLALSVAQQVEITKSLWIITIKNYGNIALLSEQALDALSSVMITATSTLIVQIYFLRRIFLFGEGWLVKWGIPTFLAGPVLWQWVGCVVYTVKAVTLDPTEEATLKYLDMSIQICTAVVDVAIAMIMCMLLDSRRTGMNSNKQLISHLMVSSVNSGLWTALLSVINVIMILTKPGTLWYCITYFPLASLYANSLLGNWNVRNTTRSISAGGINTSVHSGTHVSRTEGNQSVAMKPLVFTATEPRVQAPDVEIYGKNPVSGYNMA